MKTTLGSTLMLLLLTIGSYAQYIQANINTSGYEVRFGALEPMGDTFSTADLCLAGFHKRFLLVGGICLSAK